jgi:hypothetical protein
MDLSDERLHRKRIPWESLVADGFEPQKVMLEAQRKGMYRLARSARHRIENQKRLQSNQSTLDIRR